MADRHTMTSKRRIIDMGTIGKIPVDTLSESYLETDDGAVITVYQAKAARTVGSWVYSGASCMAKYLESDAFKATAKDGGKMAGKRVIELGAGTGVVGLLAGYYGADVTITDMESLIPLIAFNLQENTELMKGNVTVRALPWGCNLGDFTPGPDYLILANCVYYESSLEPLAQTTVALSDENTTVLACYEEKTSEIKALIKRWHAVIGQHFDIVDIPRKHFIGYCDLDCVRIVKMKKKTT